MKVYFDNAATTPMDPKVQEHYIHLIKNEYGNPSSIHHFGRKARSIVEDARSKVAKHLKASVGEIFFTSCATEANNTVIKGAVSSLGVRKIITTKMEHHCVLHTVQHIQSREAAEVVFLSVDQQGDIDLVELEREIKSSNHKCLVSIMHGNNETGILYPIKEISKICQEHGALFHCDTVQTMGKYSIDVATQYFSFLSGSGHKFFGPKGVGFFYMNSENIIPPYLHGGAQERNMRAGTENVYGISAMAEALSLSIQEGEERQKKATSLRDYFEKELKSRYADIVINSSERPRLYYVSSVSFPDTPKADMLMFNLDIAGISASSGSACSSGIERDSDVLIAMGHDSKRKTIRFSFSHINTQEEVDYLLDKLSSMTPTR